ncbi:MAG: SDR family NAD(P)-dependent oxidoreductase [Chloroflexota bacterium]|mgnify:CR=1 FL=1|nr:SDR family NAD(P)-dependent oxidoreductase [Chloroflexota bacterium]
MGVLEGRVAIIVGGASGIGRATVDRFVAEGARVFVADVNGEGIARAIAAHGHNTVDGCEADVRDEEAVRRAVERCVRRFGKLDIAVNSAGTGAFAAVHELALAEWQRVVDVNLTGVFLCLKHEAAQMIRQGGGGVIVNIASLNARQPAEGLAAYCAAKAGVAMLTATAALELGRHGIRVNAIGSGLVRTPLTEPLRAVPGVEDAFVAETPLGFTGEPADVAALALWMASPEARWLTGQTVYLDGGASLRKYPRLFDFLGPPASREG